VKYNPLGATGLVVSELGFGAFGIGGNQFGNSYGSVHDAQSIKTIHLALDKGCNFFDTADVYGRGHSEEILGTALRRAGHIHDVIIATKGGCLLDGSDRQDFSREYLTTAIEASLRRLGRDYIDLYQLHNPTLSLLRAGDIFDALDRLCASGKIRHAGVSVHSVDEGLECLRHPICSTIQIVYNLFSQIEPDTSAEALLPHVQQAGVGLIAREPLANSFLARSHEIDEKYEDGDIRAELSGAARRVRIALADSLRPKAAGAPTLAQLALRFVLDEPVVSTTIVGLMSPQQVEENFAASTIRSFADYYAMYLQEMRAPMRRPDPMVSFCSGPFWPDTLSVRETGAVELLRESARRIAEHPAVMGGAPQLRSALAEIALKSSFNRPTWSPSVGQVYAALGDPGRDRAVAAAVNLVLDFIEAVSPFSCTLEFDLPQKIISDPLILPASTHLTISWRAPKLALDTKDSTFELSQRSPSRITASAGPCAVAPAGCFEAVGGLGVLNGAGGDVFPSLGAVPSTIDFREASSSIEDALKLLRQCAPEYIDWILPMVRWAIPVSAPPGEFASGSGFHNPGVVAVSLPSDALTLAESFVHETAHQYLFLASRFTRLTEADDGLYYSPLAGRDRPLEMILVAFHAAANIASFFSLVADRRPDLAASEAATMRVTKHCRVLADHLLNNRHITDSGLSLFEPIYRWLTDRRLV
jgi:HEXXH motif-containing protein